MSLKAIKTTFLIAAIYDLGLGVVFGLFFAPIFRGLGTPLPYNTGYIQLSAAYVFVFGVAFYIIFKNPQQNWQMIVVGILMKLAFIIVIFGHLIFDTIPPVFVPIAVLDILFVPPFVMAYNSLKGLAAAEVADTGESF